MTVSQRNLGGVKAVVFGGCGFLGSNVAAGLARAGATTVVYDTVVCEPDTPQGIEMVQGDALDAAKVREVLAGADRVFAFAGAGGAPESLRDPLGDLAVNCNAQLILLEAVREVCREATVVFPGSRLEYGRPMRLPVGEDHSLLGSTPYAINKSACAAYYRMYAQVHGLNAVVLRLSNPYGPHPLQESYKGFGVLNHFIDRALLDRPITLFGDGSQLRDFVYIDDVVEAVMEASARRGLGGRAINIGSGEGVSLAMAAEEVVELAGRGSVIQVPWPADLSLIETGDFYFDVSRAREVLDWEPKTSLRLGLELTLTAKGGCR